ncbi:hypothetical protein MTR_8g018640 [Medicago truncatula]|uniref:Uncharacterized protein n=1 Tax=Medicago truncatula TaxID=3880 RepID=G7LIY8_MEDTR|nr:hypothetical protein MTR_8g018640 [Medicago truncatula]
MAETLNLYDASTGGIMKIKTNWEVIELIDNMSLNEYCPQSNEEATPKEETIDKMLEARDVNNMAYAGEPIFCPIGGMPHTFDPALLRCGTQIFKIHKRKMNYKRDIHFELPILFFLGADIRSVCTEAGLYTISAPREIVTMKYLK